MARVRVNVRELERLQKRMEKVADEQVVAAWIEECLRDLAKKHIRKIKRRTPVNTGLLRESWKISSIKRNGAVYEIEVYTEIEYAEYVEKGFRAHWVPGYWQGKQFVYDKDAKTGMQVGKPGTFVEGRFMMKFSEEDLEREMPAFMKRKQLQLLKNLMNGRG